MELPMFRLSPVVVLLMVACGGDGGGGTTEPTPTPTASLTGHVREAGTGKPVSGASVSVGPMSDATQNDGRFAFQNVPLGAAVTISIVATGYVTYTQAISIQAGPNSHEVSLDRQTLFELGDKVLYLTPGITTYRGVLFDLPALTGDSRPWVRGDLTQTHPGYGNLPEHRRRSLIFAEQQQFAILGTNTFPMGSSAEPSTLDDLLPLLANFAAQTGHPELAQAPLLLFGHSLGGCVAYNFMRRHAAQVIGLITQKGPCHAVFVDGGAQSVPAYLVIGAEDPQNSIGNITALFETGRAAGAPWSVIVLAGEDHSRTNQFDLLFNWMNAVVALRLPSVSTLGQPVQLRPIDTPSGWLGNPSTATIAPYGSYQGDKLQASWFPTEQSALDWQFVLTVEAQTAKAGSQDRVLGFIGSR